MSRFATLAALPVLFIACDPAGGLSDCPECLDGTTTTETAADSEDLMEAPQSACGNVWYVDMTMRGVLTDEMGQPLEGAEVWLEERAWSPIAKSHGMGMTDANGMFEFQVYELPIIEDCWGWAALYHVVGERGEASGEVEANLQVIKGWLDQSFVADVSNLPFTLENAPL